jgi:hypothetical protein
MNNPVHSASYELVSLMLESNHKFMDKRNLYREREREKLMSHVIRIRSLVQNGLESI